MRDIGHEIPACSLESIKLGDIASHQKSLMGAVGNKLKLQHTLGIPQAAQHNRFVPIRSV